MRAAGYDRVSTDEQATAGLRMSADEERVRAYVEDRGWEFAGMFTDAGISGARRDRPGLDHWLADLPTLDAVVVPKLDQLGRSAAHLHHLFEQFDAAGVQLLSLGENIDPATLDGRTMRNVLTMMAELERDFVKQRVAATSGRRARAGLLEGRPSYAMRSLGEGRCEWAPPDRVEHIRLMFRLAREGKTLHATSEHLAARGIVQRTGKPWGTSNVNQRLRDPVYKGQRRRRNADGGHDLWPLQIGGIVSEEEWDEANRAVDARGTARGRYGRPSRLFLAQGMLTCGRCGQKMQVNAPAAPARCTCATPAAARRRPSSGPWSTARSCATSSATCWTRRPRYAG
jgi:site-specific DNA recombinase